MILSVSLPQEIAKAKTSNGSSMVGVGITPEGINQNYVMYEFALDRGWSQKSTDVQQWINQYTMSRYGIENTHIQTAWQILKVILDLFSQSDGILEKKSRYQMLIFRS